MNRCHISRQYLRDLLDGARGKPKNRKVRDFLQKWKPTIHQGKLYYGDRRIVPYEETEAILKREAEENGMPLSRDGAFHYLKKKYVGFKKRHIIAWLKRVELLQLIHRRPHKETRINTRNREGTANYFMKNNKLNLGVDLFAMPKPQWSSYSFFFVAVLQRSGYTWIIPQKNKKAASSLVNLKEVFKECKQLFGHEPTGVSTDDGSEFKAVFDQWLKQKGIKRKILSWCDDVVGGKEEFHLRAHLCRDDQVAWLPKSTCTDQSKGEQYPVANYSKSTRGLDSRRLHKKPEAL